MSSVVGMGEGITVATNDVIIDTIIIAVIIMNVCCNTYCGW